MVAMARSSRPRRRWCGRWRSMLGFPAGASPSEGPQANGRAKQRVRSTKARLRIIVAEMQRKGVEVLESPTLKSWAVRRAGWTENHLLRSDAEIVDGCIVKVSPYEDHAGKSASMKLAAFIERILARAREDEPAQPRWKVGWFLGTVGADAEVLEADGKHKLCGSWRHSPDAENDVNREERHRRRSRSRTSRRWAAALASLVRRSRTLASATPYAGRWCTTEVWRQASGR